MVKKSKYQPPLYGAGIFTAIGLGIGLAIGLQIKSFWIILASFLGGLIGRIADEMFV